MARLFLSSGQTYGTVGAGSPATEIFGTLGNETVNVAADGDAIFDASFNKGGDTIVIGGNAASYTASVSGSNIVLTSASGANIVIPFGSTGANIQFADASAARVLKFDTTSNSLKLGTQTIPATGTTTVAAGDVTTPTTPSEYVLTPNQDILTGSAGNNLFLADIVQVNGLQVNTLGTGDNINGGGGTDRLTAQIYRAATFDGSSVGGIVNGGSNAPIQPRLNSVEQVLLEAQNSDLTTKPLPYNLSANDITPAQATSGYVYSNNTEIYFNAKNVRGHNEIWSYYSEANLTVSDLTTIVSDGGHDNARNTSDITIGVAYSSEQDTFWDSSDLKVFFDQDFLLTGKESLSRAFYYLVDEDADLDGRPQLDRIDVDGLIFSIAGYNGGNPITIKLPDVTAINTHLEFVAALQADLAAKKAAGLVPADLQIYVDPAYTDTTFNDAGQETNPFPAIVVQSQSSVITPLGYSHPIDITGNYDVFGRFDTISQTADLPLSVNIALEKAGSGGEGGDVIVGSNDKYNHGIDVFNVTVYGDKSRPSWVDYLNSTGDSYTGIGQNGELDVINITSNNVSSSVTSSFPSTSTWASLTIGATNDNLTLIDAHTFKGDLTLGNLDEVRNLATLEATGGGNVKFYGEVDQPGAFRYTTGAGNDLVDVDVDGNALKNSTSGLLIETGAGKDTVIVNYQADGSINYRERAQFTLNTLPSQANLPVGDGSVTVTISNLFGAGGNFSTTILPGTLALDNSTLDSEAEAVALIASRINSQAQSLYTASGGATLILTAKELNNNLTDTNVSIVHIGAGNTATDLSSYVSGGSAYSSAYGGTSNADFPNHIILNNVDINTGGDDDTVWTSGAGKFDINTGEGNDTIYSAQDGGKATWVFNVDRANYNTGHSVDSLPGVPLRYSLIDGASVTVTFSGPGSDSGGSGGGVMKAYGNNSAFGDASAYKNGFEKTVTIDVPSGKAFGTQVDLNKAIIAAIESDPVLSKLLKATIGANNTLYVTTIGDGGYVVEDLDVGISRLGAYAKSSTAVISSTLIAEAVTLGLVNTGEIATGATWSSLTQTQYDKLVGAALDNGFYSGLNNNPTLDGLTPPSTSFYNLYNAGYASYSYYYSTAEVDHTHTPGLGNDVVVLSTNYASSNFVPDSLPVSTVYDSNVYATLDGWLFDLASNETIVLDTTGAGQKFGYDTIVNFTTAGVGDHDPANIVGQGSASGTYTPPNSGFDFLDFTAYLTSTFQPSTADHRIPVTLEDVSGGDAPVLTALSGPSASGGDNGLIDANEVVVISLDNTGTYAPGGSTTAETFANLTATTLAEVINNSATNGGGFASLANGSLNTNNGYGANDLINGAGKAVILVQNADNLGEYRVFEVSWNGSSVANTNHTATVTDRGTLDFGTSLEGLDELNLVGSTEYSHFNFDSSYLLA